MNDTDYLRFWASAGKPHHARGLQVTLALSVCVSEGAIMSAHLSDDDVSAEGHGSPFGPAHVRMHSQLTGNAAHPPMTTFTVSVAAAECQSRYVSSDKVPAL